MAELRSWKSLRDEAQHPGALAHNLRAHMLHAARAADALAQEIHERGCLKARFRSAEISRSDLLQQLLKKIDRPVLFVWGEHDVTAEPRSAAELLTSLRRKIVSRRDGAIRDRNNEPGATVDRVHVLVEQVLGAC